MFVSGLLFHAMSAGIFVVRFIKPGEVEREVRRNCLSKRREWGRREWGGTVFFSWYRLLLVCGPADLVCGVQRTSER